MTVCIFVTHTCLAESVTQKSVVQLKLTLNNAHNICQNCLKGLLQVRQLLKD